MDYLFPIETPWVPIANSRQRFPVHRIYCVGKNYADHAKEMGGDPAKELPCFFSKPSDSVVCRQEGTSANDAIQIPYPSRTGNLHYEIELVLAIGRQVKAVKADSALECLYGYGVGIDLTRRDLQNDAKNAGRPWDVAKGFDNSAPLSPLHPVSETGYLEEAVISLSVNGELKQRGNIADMTWKTSEIIAELSTYFTLLPGDLIFTGTPAGVGPVKAGDRIVGLVEGLDRIVVELV